MRSAGGEHAHEIDLRQYIAHTYNFEHGEEWHMNLELELTFYVVSFYKMPILFNKIICVSVTYQNVLLKIFFTSSNKTLFVLCTLIFA